MVAQRQLDDNVLIVVKYWFESCTCNTHFLGYKVIRLLVIIERHIVRENSMPFKMVLWCNGSTRDFGSLRDCSTQSGTTNIG